MNRKKKSVGKVVKITKKSAKLTFSAPGKIRLVLSCTEEEKKYIKVLAAIEDKTISDYLLAPARRKIPTVKCDYPGCSGEHIPNVETVKALRESEKGIGLTRHDSLDDFWKSMGMKPRARNR